MTFTYDAEDLTTVLARTRLKCGDTKGGEGGAFLQDEELEVLFTDAGTTGASLADNFRTAFAVKAVKLILGKIAREEDTDGAGVRTTRSQKTTQYRDLLRDLNSEMVGEALPILTGTSISEENTLKQDVDWKGPTFEQGMDDHPASADLFGRRRLNEEEIP